MIYSHTSLSQEEGYSVFVSYFPKWVCIHSFIPVEETQYVSELLFYRKSANDVIEALLSPVFSQMCQNNITQTVIRLYH